MSMLRSAIVSAVMGVGFLGFIIGVPSPEMVYLNVANQPHQTGGYFGSCDDRNSGCDDNQVNAIYHCAKNDQPFLDYNYPKNFVYVGSQDMCKRLIAAEAFGILAIIFSFAAVWAALFQKYTHRHAGATSAFLASIFGVIALGVYFGGKINGLNIAFNNSDTVSQALQDNEIKLGYSAGLQIVGVICSFFGSLLSVVAGKA